MVTTVERRRSTTALPPTVLPQIKGTRRRKGAVLAIAVVVGVAIGTASFLIIDDGPSVGPSEVAEARSQLMAESLEAQWLADPANAAQTRAHQIAESLERQWIADPTNVARVRAESLARILEQKYLAALN